MDSGPLEQPQSTAFEHAGRRGAYEQSSLEASHQLARSSPAAAFQARRLGHQAFDGDQFPGEGYIDGGVEKVRLGVAGQVDQAPQGFGRRDPAPYGCTFLGEVAAVAYDNGWQAW